MRPISFLSFQEHPIVRLLVCVAADKVNLIARAVGSSHCGHCWWCGLLQIRSISFLMLSEHPIVVLLVWAVADKVNLLAWSGRCCR